MLVRAIKLSPKFCLLVLFIFIKITPVFALNKEETSRKKKFIYWLHNRNSPKHLGLDDPHLPCFVKFRPLLLPLPNNYELPKEFLIREDSLDMRSLTPKLLERLSPSDLKILLDYLAHVPV